MDEKRISKRLDLNARLKISSIKSARTDGKKVDMRTLKADEFDIEMVNISKDGMAFKCKEKLELHTYYETNVILWTKDNFDVVIEVMRMEQLDNESTLYGCRFIGMVSIEQLKIDIYDMFNESK